MRAMPLLTLFLLACGSGIDAPPRKTDTGDASDAQLVVGVEALDFGAIVRGELYQQSLSLSNPGETDLVISSLTVPEPFRISPGNLQLRAGVTSTITVYVQALDYADHDVAITLETTDATIGTVSVPLRASVVRDEDGDGHDAVEAGGDDCDDGDTTVFAGATEVWYDGVDQDCDGASDYDQDGDGYESEVYNTDESAGGGDCQDTLAEFYPGAPDAWYDNRDTNCRGDNDWDQDGDGYGASAYGRGSDCDDEDEDVNSLGSERLDGKDNDCDGTTDNGAKVEFSAYIWAADGNYDRAGYATAIGDLDRDGIADMVIGAPSASATSPGGAGRGAVAIWRGSSRLPSSGMAIDRADNYLEGASMGDYVGSFVSVLGDTDGDTYAELAVGAFQRGSNTGIVYVLQGRDALYRDLSDAQVTFTGTSSSQLGKGIATDVDLDGDGNNDIVMTATSSSGNNAVVLDYGNSSTGSVSLSATDAQFSTDGTELAFHRNAPVGGDFDGDGLDDLVFSDGSADYGSTNTGAVWVLWGTTTRYAGSSDLESRATTVAYGSSSGEVGWATQLGGDWDGDGDEELWLYSSGTGLYVIPGGTGRRAAFTPASEALVTYSWDSGDQDAEMLRQVGDWTGDGVPEILAFIEDSGSGTGNCWLYSSEVRSGTWDAEEYRAGDVTGSTAHGNGNAGFGLAPKPGDVDDDGDLDQLMGDPEYDSGAGEVYLLRNTLIE
jgi:hypothetical protein